MNTSPNQPANDARPWLPIEQANKDGKYVEIRWISMDGPAFDEAKWNGELWVAKRLNRWTGLPYICLNPTHFRPLPLARTEAGEGNTLRDVLQNASTETRRQAMEDAKEIVRLAREDVEKILSTKPEEGGDVTCTGTIAPSTCNAEASESNPLTQSAERTCPDCGGKGYHEIDGSFFTCFICVKGKVTQSLLFPNSARDAAREAAAAVHTQYSREWWEQLSEGSKAVLEPEYAQACLERQKIAAKLLPIIQRHLPNLEQLREEEELWPAFMCNIASRVVWLRQTVEEDPELKRVAHKLARYTARMEFETELLSGRMDQVQTVINQIKSKQP
jgi:hypothetical protein